VAPKEGTYRRDQEKRIHAMSGGKSGPTRGMAILRGWRAAPKKRARKTEGKEQLGKGGREDLWVGPGKASTEGDKKI